MRTGTTLLTTLALLALAALPALSQTPVPTTLFLTSDRCMGCHNQLTAPDGQDVSFGSDWRASMMAHSSRDPYWQASVRREVVDHPSAGAAIENECAKCHMPMARSTAGAHGGMGQVFAHLPVATAPPADPAAPSRAALAADGVSCTLCHQIREDGLGTEESFVAGFVIDTTTAPGNRQIFGPYQVDAGRTALMRSATDFEPARATHVQSAELCATCHTLFTHSLGPDGEVVGELPEQVPYLEWKHSAFYHAGQTCQACHMPHVDGDTAITGVVGQPREAVNRHVFRGGNFLMPRIFNRHRGELGVQALPAELDAMALRTREHLQESAATVAVEDLRLEDGRLRLEVVVENLAGHKLPTAYPSRRAWLHVVVKDGGGDTVFESGALAADGSIAGNDNDADPRRYEPHHAEITDPEQVQIYEPILADPQGGVTTGLLTAVTYAKDNRLPPIGFDKATAGEDIAVHGAAADDPDFGDGGDRVRYTVDVGEATGPFRVTAELWYQPIGFRWAQNLKPYEAAETQRLVRYYDEMAEVSAIVLAEAAGTGRVHGGSG